MIFNPKQGIKTAKVSKMQIQKSVFCESYDDMQLISIYNLYLLYGGECFTRRFHTPLHPGPEWRISVCHLCECRIVQ